MIPISGHSQLTETGLKSILLLKTEKPYIKSQGQNPFCRSHNYVLRCVPLSLLKKEMRRFKIVFIAYLSTYCDKLITVVSFLHVLM